MADTVTAERRSEIMSHIRSKGTAPEMAVRRLVFRLGYRYRLHRKDLPGKPDLVFSSRRKAIFVHGCFWHQHRGCVDSRIPRTNQAYWIPKLERNNKRDKSNRAKLAKMGWRSLAIWGCWTRNTLRLERSKRSSNRTLPVIL